MSTLRVSPSHAHARLQLSQIGDFANLGKSLTLARTREAATSIAKEWIIDDPSSPAIGSAKRCNSHPISIGNSRGGGGGLRAVAKWKDDESAEAKKRQGTRTDLNPTSGKHVPEVERARDKAGERGSKSDLHPSLIS